MLDAKHLGALLQRSNKHVERTRFDFSKNRLKVSMHLFKIDANSSREYVNMTNIIGRSYGLQRNFVIHLKFHIK